MSKATRHDTALAKHAILQLMIKMAEYHHAPQEYNATVRPGVSMEVVAYIIGSTTIPYLALVFVRLSGTADFQPCQN